MNGWREGSAQLAALSSPSGTPMLVFMTRMLPGDARGVSEAVQLLGDSALVALPTETVYGLAARADDGEAVARIFALKARPRFNPLIVHLPDLEAAEQVARCDERARLLAETFWPGPLTLVLPRRTGSPVHDLAVAGLDTVAVRVPDHPLTLQVLRQLGRPVAAPSANPSGRLSPTGPAHVAALFGAEGPPVLAGGKAQIGLESTILDLTTAQPTLLRAGAITAEELEGLIGPLTDASTRLAGDAPRAPGQSLRHYAPTTPLRLEAFSAEVDEALLGFGPVLGAGTRPAGFRNLSDAGDLYQAASNLFDALHELDALAARAIAVMPIPEEGLGRAINDRLRRAAGAQQAGQNAEVERA